MRQAHAMVSGPQGDLGWLLAVCNVPADPVPLPASGTGGLVESGQLAIFGGSLTNSSTNASTVVLYDGLDAKGGPFATLNVPASSSIPFSLPRAGVFLEMGLFCTVTGGSVTGSAYVAHLWKYPYTPPGE